jgi:hypothetical protein
VLTLRTSAVDRAQSLVLLKALLKDVDTLTIFKFCKRSVFLCTNSSTGQTSRVLEAGPRDQFYPLRKVQIT